VRSWCLLGRKHGQAEDSQSSSSRALERYLILACICGKPAPCRRVLVQPSAWVLAEDGGGGGAGRVSWCSPAAWLEAGKAEAQSGCSLHRAVGASWAKKPQRAAGTEAKPAGCSDRPGPWGLRAMGAAGSSRHDPHPARLGRAPGHGPAPGVMSASLSPQRAASRPSPTLPVPRSPGRSPPPPYSWGTWGAAWEQP